MQLGLAELQQQRAHSRGSSGSGCLSVRRCWSHCAVSAHGSRLHHAARQCAVGTLEAQRAGSRESLQMQCLSAGACLCAVLCSHAAWPLSLGQRRQQQWIGAAMAGGKGSARSCGTSARKRCVQAACWADSMLFRRRQTTACAASLQRNRWPFSRFVSLLSCHQQRPISQIAPARALLKPSESRRGDRGYAVAVDPA